MSARKRGLGRGLEALLDEPASTQATQSLPLGRLKPNRLQPRVHFGSKGLAELAASIRSHGLVQPIVVSPRTDGDFNIVAGERRWRAARQAGLEQVPVVVRPVEGDRELLELALVENLHRSDLNPIETAEAYRKLRQEFGLSQDEVALRVGKSRAAISNTVRLLALPEEVQEWLREGSLTAGQARPLLSLTDLDEQIRAARKIIKNSLSSRDAEGLVRKRKGAKKPQVDPDTSAAAEKLTRKLNTKVEIRRRGKRGVVTISFHSEEELIRLYEMLMASGSK